MSHCSEARHTNKDSPLIDLYKEYGIDLNFKRFQASRLSSPNTSTIFLSGFPYLNFLHFNNSPCV
jgi:hypothetical protein